MLPNFTRFINRSVISVAKRRQDLFPKVLKESSPCSGGHLLKDVKRITLSIRDATEIPTTQLGGNITRRSRMATAAAYSTPKSHTEVRDLTKEEWAKRLTPEQFSVCREQCTEAPFSGEYNSHYDPGMYRCVCCGVDLFSSGAKYNSGTGWPSFYEAYKTSPNHSNVIERPENSADFVTFRTEVICKKCDSHLGHVFDDGPKPTGKRYCINSVALKFTPQ